MDLQTVRMEIPEGAESDSGHAHFIKTAEDLYEVMVNTVPGAKFAVAFNEASGPCLTRIEANDDDLRRAATANARAIGAGHIFVLLIRQAYPINVLGRIRDCFEVCTVHCATAEPGGSDRGADRARTRDRGGDRRFVAGRGRRTRRRQGPPRIRAQAGLQALATVRRATEPSCFNSRTQRRLSQRASPALPNQLFWE